MSATNSKDLFRIVDTIKAKKQLKDIQSSGSMNSKGSSVI